MILTSLADLTKVTILLSPPRSMSSVHIVQGVNGKVAVIKSPAWLSQSECLSCRQWCLTQEYSSPDLQFWHYPLSKRSRGITMHILFLKQRYIGLSQRVMKRLQLQQNVAKQLNKAAEEQTLGIHCLQGQSSWINLSQMQLIETSIPK